MRRRVEIPCVTALLLALACGVSAADDVVCGEIPHWLPVEVNGADVVVLGEVAEVNLSAVRILTTDVVTYVTVRVGTILKGPAVGDSLGFWTAYAAKKGERVLQSSPPLAAFAPGDEIIVFTEANAGGELYSRGWALDISGGSARTPEDLLYGRDGIPLECYESWVDSLVSARSPDSLAEHADAVAVVRVEQAVRTEKGHADLERVMAVIERSIKGPDAGDTMVITLPARGLWDVALLSPGDSALVFLKLRQDGSYNIAGGRDGAYLLDEKTGLWHRSARRSAIPALPGEHHWMLSVIHEAVDLDQLTQKGTQGVQSQR